MQAFSGGDDFEDEDDITQVSRGMANVSVGQGGDVYGVQGLSQIDVNGGNRGLDTHEIFRNRADGLNEYREAVNDLLEPDGGDELDLKKQQEADKLKLEVQAVEYSDLIMKIEETPVIPFHTSNIVKNHIWGEVSVDKNASNQWAPESAISAFGSKRAWAQGLELKVQKKKAGNLQNCYIVQFKFDFIQNDLECPVGVVVSHDEKNPDGTTKTKALSGMEYTFAGKDYHCIIPPGEHRSITIYTSKKNINHPFGAQFPGITAHNLERGIIPHVKKFAIPKLHPCAAWLFQEAGNRNWPKPSPGIGEEWEDFFIVSDEHKRIAVKEVRSIIENNLPIVNLETIKFAFTKINSQIKTKKREKRLEPGEANLNNRVCFLLNSVHLFRDGKDEVPLIEEQTSNTISPVAPDFDTRYALPSGSMENSGVGGFYSSREMM